MCFRRNIWMVVVGLLVLVGSGQTYGQQPQEAPDTIPQLSAAEALFDEGVRAYEEQMYELAHRRFLAVVRDYRFNRRTTAALLMTGNTLFQLKEYKAAQEYYTRLIKGYPESRYVSAATRGRRKASKQLQADPERVEVVNLGVALPLKNGNESSKYTQTLFNGIRMAVDQYNANGSEPQVRIVFRSSKNQPEAARQAVQQLIQEDSVDVIIGPLYSTSEVIPAAGVAEQHDVPLIAPMATEESVTMDRSYVFQINPPLSLRGRLMARYAIQELEVERMGLLAELGTDGERMAKTFRSELLKNDVEVAFFELLTAGRDWYRLPRRINPDTLQTVDGVFIPITGERASSRADAALGSFERMQQSPRILGNSSWRNLEGFSGLDAFDIIFEDSFWSGSAAATGFERGYNRLAGSPPNRLAYVGYDVTHFLIQKLTQGLSANTLAEALRQAQPYKGEGMRINFKGGQVNHGLYYMGYKNGRLVTVE